MNRCRCCPRCLTEITPTDVTVQTAAGAVLAAHAQAAPFPYPVEHLTSVTSPLSVVNR
jgi:hypothetical protein